MKAAALLLAALILTGCNSPGVIKPLPYPEAQLYKCADGHYKARNAFKQVNPCL